MGGRGVGHVVRSRSRRCVALVLGVVAAAGMTTACGSSGAPAGASAPPQYPNLVGTAVAAQPDNGGNLSAPRHGLVILTLSNGKRLVVPSSVETPGTRGLLCRTHDLNHSDGTYAPPCRIQAFVSHGRAVWLRVIGADTVGTAVSGSNRWLALSDGTALPLPAPPRRPQVNCRALGYAVSVEVFSHTHHLVRVEVNDDGTLARVDCVSSMKR